MRLTKDVVIPKTEAVYEYTLVLSEREFALLRQHYGSNPCGSSVNMGFSVDEVMNLYRVLDSVG